MPSSAATTSQGEGLRGRGLSTVVVPGRAAAASRSAGDRAWRAAVAQAGRHLAGSSARGLRLDLVLAPRRWVDLDSLVEVVVAGLRDGGAVTTATLEALMATKTTGPEPGVRITATSPAALADEAPPGPAALDLDAPLDRPLDRAAKRALRDRVAAAWGERPLLDGPVWAELALAGSRALLGPMEAVLDVTEPVLGRDPRGQPGQEFFPFDDRIVWRRRVAAGWRGPARRRSRRPCR